MSNVHYNHAAGAVAHGAATEASFAARARAMFSRLIAWRRLTQAERELSALDDRMLDDIGVPRAEIHQRVWSGRA